MRQLAPASLVALLALAGAACGGKAGPAGGTLDNRAGGVTSAAPAVTLAEDVAELARAAGESDSQSGWPERATFLGWTADRRAAYRVLVCNPDELGGRGPYCELQVCSAGADAGPAGFACEDAAQLALYGEIDFDAAATTAAAEAATRALGPLAAGTPRPPAAVALSTEERGLTAHIFDRAQVVLPPSDEDGLGVVEARATDVVDSPDGGCRAVLGSARVLSEYEGVRGHIPFLFAAVGCR